MAQANGPWAELDPVRQDLLELAERTLGADILLAYDKQTDDTAYTPPANLLPATLDESQLDCLHGLEQQLDSVVVAFTKP